MGTQKNKVLVSVYLPREVHEMLRVASFRTRVSMSLLVEATIRQHLFSVAKKIEEDEQARSCMRREDRDA
jgi:hypothetical protein